MSEPLDIHTALVSCSEMVGVVGKDRKMQQGTPYAYRSIEQITPRVHAAFIALGVVCSPRVVHAEYRDVVTKKGGTMREATLTVEYTFSTAVSSLTACTMGEATDSSDKASSKALTAAWKQALVQVLCIPVEEADDPDHDRVDRGTVEPVSQRGVKNALVARAKELGWSDPKVIAQDIWQDSGITADPVDRDVADALVASITTPPEPVVTHTETDGGHTEYAPGEEPF